MNLGHLVTQKGRQQGNATQSRHWNKAPNSKRPPGDKLEKPKQPFFNWAGIHEYIIICKCKHEWYSERTSCHDGKNLTQASQQPGIGASRRRRSDG